MSSSRLRRGRRARAWFTGLIGALIGLSLSSVGGGGVATAASTADEPLHSVDTSNAAVVSGLDARGQCLFRNGVYPAGGLVIGTPPSRTNPRLLTTEATASIAASCAAQDYVNSAAYRHQAGIPEFVIMVSSRDESTGRLRVSVPERYHAAALHALAAFGDSIELSIQKKDVTFQGRGDSTLRAGLQTTG